MFVRFSKSESWLKLSCVTLRLLVFITLIILSCLTVAPVLGQDCPHDGDVNEDGTLTMQDARLALLYALGIAELDDCQAQRADMDCDGEVKINDFVGIIRCKIMESIGRPCTPCEDGEDNDTDNDTSTTTTILPDAFKCIPCGDFAPTCDVQCAATINSGRKCAVCMSYSDNGTSVIGYDDGSYYETSVDPETEKVITTYYDQYGKVCFSYESKTGESTLYDNSGKECYTIKTGTVEGDVIILLDDRTYTIHDDDTWACPDGKTWESPASCQDNDTVPNPDVEDCPNTYQLPPCNIFI